MRIPVDRLRLKIVAGGRGEEPVRLVDDSALMRGAAGVREGAELEASDIGPQFSYRGVFVIECVRACAGLLCLLLRARRPARRGRGGGRGGGPCHVTHHHCRYAGPILIAALCATRPAWLYGGAVGALAVPWHPGAVLAMAMWMAHFIKREMETVFVHRFVRTRAVSLCSVVGPSACVLFVCLCFRHCVFVG